MEVFLVRKKRFKVTNFCFVELIWTLRLCSIKHNNNYWEISMLIKQTNTRNDKLKKHLAKFFFQNISNEKAKIVLVCF